MRLSFRGERGCLKILLVQDICKAQEVGFPVSHVTLNMLLCDPLSREKYKRLEDMLSFLEIMTDNNSIVIFAVKNKSYLSINTILSR